MFEYIYEWIQNIAFYMVMVTVIMHMIPNPDYKKYIRFFTGLVLVLMMIAPVLRFLGMGDAWQEIYTNEEYQKQMQKMEEAEKYLEEDVSAGFYSQNEDLQDSKEDLGEKSSDDIEVGEIRIGR